MIHPGASLVGLDQRAAKREMPSMSAGNFFLWHSKSSPHGMAEFVGGDDRRSVSQRGEPYGFSSNPILALTATSSLASVCNALPIWL